MNINDIDSLLKENNKKIKRLERQQRLRPQAILKVLMESNQLLRLKGKLILAKSPFQLGGLLLSLSFSRN